MTPATLNDPQSLEEFQQAQGELVRRTCAVDGGGRALPYTQANQGFRDLRITLEGTENRITVARNRYIQSVQEYNVLVRSFPSNLTAMALSYTPKPSFTVHNEAQLATPRWSISRLRKP